VRLPVVATTEAAQAIPSQATDVPLSVYFKGVAMTTITRFSAILCGLAWAASAQADVSKQDEAFLQQAAAGGLYEVQAGHLAQQKGTSSAVQSFGSTLVKDHTAANAELKALASSKGVRLPTTLPNDKTQRLANVAQAKNFDQTFIDEVGLNDHAHDIGLFEKASRSADDAQVRAFAAKTLPALQAHRTHALGMKKNQGQ